MSARGSDTGVYVLHLVGANDVPAADRVRGDLRAALRGGDPLVVDLSCVHTVEPAVLALLVDAVAACEESERPCVLLVPDACSAAVRSRFGPDALGRLLPVARTWDEALRRAAAAGPAPGERPDGQAPAPGWTMPVS